MKKQKVQHNLVPEALRLWLNENPLDDGVIEAMRKLCEQGFDVNMTLSRYHIRKNMLFCAPMGGSLISLSCGLLAHQTEEGKPEPLTTQQWQNVMQWQSVLVEQFGGHMHRYGGAEHLASPLERALIWGSVAGVKRVLELHKKSKTALDWSDSAQKGYKYWFLSNIRHYKVSDHDGLIELLDQWFDMCNMRQKHQLLEWLEEGLVEHKTMTVCARLGSWFCKARAQVPEWSWRQSESNLKGSSLFSLYESERQKRLFEQVLYEVPKQIRMEAPRL